MQAPVSQSRHCKNRWPICRIFSTTCSVVTPNLSVDLSWSVREHYLFEDKDEVDAQWLALIEKFSDRFLIGSDKVGKFTGLDENLDGYAGLLGRLSKEAADRVGRKNALALLPPRGAGSVAVSDDPALAQAEPRE